MNYKNTGVLLLCGLSLLSLPACNKKGTTTSHEQVVASPEPTEPTEPSKPSETSDDRLEKLKKGALVLKGQLFDKLSALKALGVTWDTDWNPVPQKLLEYKLNLEEKGQFYDWKQVQLLGQDVQVLLKELTLTYTEVLSEEDRDSYRKLLSQVQQGLPKEFMEGSTTLFEYCMRPEYYNTTAINNTIWALQRAMSVLGSNCPYLRQQLNSARVVLIHGEKGPLDLRPFLSLNKSRIEHIEIVSSGFVYSNSSLNLEPLQGMENLDFLGVQGFKVKDIAPLKNLKKLRVLDLAENNIEDVSAVSSLTHLETLILRQNEVKSVQALSSLLNLKTLDLQTNQITDVQGLSSLTRLEILNVKQNQIRSFAPLSDLYSLKDFTGKDNPLLPTEEACPTQGRSREVNGFCTRFFRDM